MRLFWFPDLDNFYALRSFCVIFQVQCKFDKGKSAVSKKLIFNISVIFLSITLFSCGSEFGILLENFVYEPYVMNQPADRVLGSGIFTDGTGGTSISTFTNPTAVLIAGGHLYIADYGNNRIVGFSSVPTTSGVDADFVMGQSDFDTGSSWPESATTMGPTSLTSDGTRLFVADYENHRILIFNSLPSVNNPTADIVVGQADMDNSTGATTQDRMLFPQDVAVAKGKMVVSDHGNSRILVYNSIPSADGADADIVLGHSIFSDSEINDGGTPTASTLSNPGGIWTNGTRIIVADAGNRRVLIWNSWPTFNFQPADVVVGKPTFTSYIAGTTSATELFLNFNSDVFVSSAGRMYVSDTTNQRVMIYNRIPSVNGAAADSVIGQPDLDSFNGGTDVDDFSNPAGLFIDPATGTLYMADENNNRILMFDTQ